MANSAISTALNNEFIKIPNNFLFQLGLYLILNITWHGKVSSKALIFLSLAFCSPDIRWPPTLNLTKRLVPALVLSNFISSSERLLSSLSVIFWQKMSDTSINLLKDYLLKELFLNKLEMFSSTEGPKKIMVIVQNLIVWKRHCLWSETPHWSPYILRRGLPTCRHSSGFSVQFTTLGTSSLNPIRL